MYRYLWYFLIFSFLGWCVEVAFHAVKSGRFVNRGFASGPICPIYGVGICLVALLLRSITNLSLLFLASALLATAVEFAVGFLMDRIFGSRWWDYSSERLNLFGYVCLRFSIIWGLLCAVAVKLLTPVDYLIAFLDNALGYILVGVLLALVASDVLTSSVRVIKFNRRLELLDYLADEVSYALSIGSDFIGNGVYKGTSRVFKEYEKMLAEAAALGVRIIDAFPTFKSKAYNRHIQIIRKRLEEIKKKQITKKQQLADKVENNKLNDN